MFLANRALPLQVLERWCCTPLVLKALSLDLESVLWQPSLFERLPGREGHSALEVWHQQRPRQTMIQCFGEASICQKIKQKTQLSPLTDTLSPGEGSQHPFAMEPPVVMPSPEASPANGCSFLCVPQTLLHHCLAELKLRHSRAEMYPTHFCI